VIGALFGSVCWRKLHRHLLEDREGQRASSILKASQAPREVTLGVVTRLPPARDRKPATRRHQSALRQQRWQRWWRRQQSSPTFSFGKVNSRRLQKRKAVVTRFVLHLRRMQRKSVKLASCRRTDDVDTSSVSGPLNFATQGNSVYSPALLFNKTRCYVRRPPSN
jgi:hypothetical protein